MNDPRHAGRQLRGFTLIEIVVVIAIIAILASLALLVGSRVTQTARINLTKDLLRTLEKTQDNYDADRGGDGKIPWKWTNQASPTRDEFAIADAKYAPGANAPAALTDRVEPSTTFYLLATKEASSVQAAIGQIDARFVVTAPLSHAAPAATVAPNNYTTIYTKSSADPQSGSTAAQPLKGLVIKDPWGNAIRYVHPKFQGGYGNYFALNTGGGWTQGSPARANLSVTLSDGSAMHFFERSFRPADPTTTTTIGDADEGICIGGRGYFYSCGPDGDPGSREDNVYTVPPSFPTETAKSSAAQ